MKQEINVIHLHVLYQHYYTGVDRYLDMYEKGCHSCKENEFVKVHKLFLTNDAKVIFPRISFNAIGELSAIVPLPQNPRLLFQDSTFWKDRYIEVVLDMLTPFLIKIHSPLVQCHNLFLSNLAIALKQRLNCRAILHLHCLPWKSKLCENKELFNRLYQLYEDNNFGTFKEEERSLLDYNLFDKIISLSEASKEYLNKVHQVDTCKIEIILNGLADDVNAVSCRNNNERIKVLYVGKISRDKGVFDLLDALEVVNKKKYKLGVTLAGSCTTDQINEIKDKYSNLDIDYVGQVSYEELKKIYSNHSFGIIPSLHEQCSYVAIEMSMYGLPIIVSKVDALAEMFEDGKNALFVPLFFDLDFGLEVDKTLLAENIIRLIKDKELREYLSVNARKNYEEHFTLGRMIKNTVNLYKQLV